MKINFCVLVGLHLYCNFCLGQEVIFLPSQNICENQWKLVFEDEFEGNAINTANWLTWAPYSSTGDDDGCLVCRTADPVTFISDNNVIVENGICRITPSIGEVVWEGQTFFQSTGLLYSIQQYKYGRFEIRCRWPSNPTSLPSFWTFVCCSNPYEEIDCFERLCYDHNPNYIQSNYHASDNEESPGCHSIGENFSENFHTFTFEWDSFHIRWFIDGEKVRTYPGLYTIGGNAVNWCNISGNYYILDNENFPRDLHHVIAGLGNYSNLFDLSDPNLTNDFEIDYIRVYQQNPEPGLVDLCPQNNIVGDEYICYGQIKEYELEWALNEGMTWFVPPQIEIINSGLDRISIRPIDEFFSGWVTIEARESQTESCFYINPKIRVYVGKPPVSNYTFNYNCSSGCFEFLISNNGIIVSQNYIWGYVKVPNGPVVSTFNTTQHCTSLSNYEVHATLQTINECGSTSLNVDQFVRCGGKKIRIFQSPINNILEWQIEDLSQFLTNNLTSLVIINEQLNIVRTINVTGSQPNTWYQEDISNLQTGSYYLFATFSENEYLNEGFQIVH